MSYKILIKDVPHFNLKKKKSSGEEKGGWRETEEAGPTKKHFPHQGFHVSARLEDTFNQISQLIDNTCQLLLRNSIDCVLSLL